MKNRIFVFTLDALKPLSMKKVFSFILIIMLSFAAFAQKGLDNDFSAIDKKNGFRDMLFGMPFETFSGMVLVEKGVSTKYYSKTGDNLKIGDYTVKSISYGFYNGKLFIVIIKTKGYLNSRGVLSVMEKLYGDGYQSNQYLESYFWLGQRATASYEENSVTHDANIIFSNNALQKSADEEKEKRDKKAASDL